MAYHYETQPVPNPLSPWLHALPREWHMAEVKERVNIEMSDFNTCFTVCQRGCATWPRGVFFFA
jgi:hypothetical protein